MPADMGTALHNKRILSIQETLRETGELDGWLFYDFRGSDPLAYRILLLDPGRHVTRRWYYWIPTDGEPVKLVHRIEPHILEELPGHSQQYVSWEQQHRVLSALLQGRHRIAMQYSPFNAVPYVSRVDAGTIDVVRSFGVDILTSADLVQRFEAVWTDEQLESHQFAATALRNIVDETFAHVSTSVSKGRVLTEYGLQQFMLARMHDAGMTTSSPPIVAVDAHSADPHYEPTESRSAAITRGNLLLIDLWAKRTQPGSVYGDITWTAYTDTRVPDKHRLIFDHVKRGRDAALSFVHKQVAQGCFPYGWEVDETCRSVIREAGYEEFFVHRTGHSIGEEVHGNGANIDNLETRDGRRLMPRTCFSIEPGIYLPEEFGIRSELDVYLSDRDALVYGQPLQTTIVPLL